MKFDAVISDLNLPGRFNGIDVLRRLKSRQIVAILITACGSEEIREQANSLGAAYMEKPVQLKDLQRRLQETQQNN